MTRHASAGPTRRRVLCCVAAAVSLAGCSGSTDRPAAVSLSGAGGCDQCGMVVDRQSGPSGQTYYREHSPEGHDPPARFCSTVCTFRHRFATERRGWRPRVTYLTDYSTVDYAVREANGDRVLSAHLDAEAFGATEELRVVAGSGVEGAMGPALVPFGDDGDAEAFAAAYGGEIVDAEGISRELVARG
ncbi:nitrous oxide reductase accessory protein NosL [Haloplanus halophilus]|uniref:nitrous oxide reductase accessory protein NosL n=1 Tax=Haloplanus halophilus TaxID=2949993 RepID=UPI00203A3F4E|nr:nitrous oxide reductase accessory protein NosL [Haloplanus sp. GDY1]